MSTIRRHYGVSFIAGEQKNPLEILTAMEELQSGRRRVPATSNMKEAEHDYLEEWCIFTLKFPELALKFEKTTPKGVIKNVWYLQNGKMYNDFANIAKYRNPNYVNFDAARLQ